MARDEAGGADLRRDLRNGRRRLDEWRQSGSRGVAMPPRLWALAGRLARRHGVWRTARALGLEFNKLKRVAGAEQVGRPALRRQPKAAKAGGGAVKFVDVSAWAAPVFEAGCRMALRGPRGEQLQMELAPAAAAQLLVQLCQAGWTTARA